MRAHFSFPALVSIAVIAAACESPTGTRIESDKTALALSPKVATIVAGASTQLHFTAHDVNGFSTIPVKITWATSDPRVATVSPDGLVTGHSNGIAQITAFWGGVHAQSTVTVVNGTTAAIPCSTGGTNKESPSNGEDPDFSKKRLCAI